MLQGIHLTLLIGPAVPVPAPQAVMDAVTSVQVTSSKDTSGFQLVFAISKNSMLLTTLLPAGYFDPISTRVIVIVTVGGMPQVLMDGVVTRQELAPSSEPGQSTLTITGEDLSALMDLIDLTGVPYPAMTEVARIYLMLAKYAAFGIVPAAIPPIPPDIPIPTDEIPIQRGTDRSYIRTLAGQAGYVFYVEPGPLPGESIAYFGPDVRIPVPQPALNINMDAETNVESLSFSFDGRYYVKSVTHNIKRGEYKQSFQLSRDGLISLTPKVPV